MNGSAFDRLRRDLWHLRHGGLSQLRASRRRRLRSSSPTTASGEYRPWDPAPRVADPSAPRVGVVLDDFSRVAFEAEWDQVLLKPSSWQTTLDEDALDLVFVESAWAGNVGAWSYHLTGPTAPRPALVEMLARCRERGVPTVFWNKEDPAHFEDFLDTARLFDHVLTTDVARVEDYRRELGHDRVGVLGFAAQTSVHNPVRSHGKGPRGDVAFAGMYFAHKYPERREQMDLLLGAAVRAGDTMPSGLEIFSRQLGGDPDYQFPEPFAQHVVGSLRYEQMLTAYRDFKVFLNVNSVVGSPSMCARRIFEISACGTPVVSTPSAAIEAFFPPDEVFTVSEPDEAENVLRALVRSPELRDRSTHRAQRRIWSQHTYAHRADEVLVAAGLREPGTRRRPTVTALVSTNRPHQLEHAVRTVAAQRDVEVQLALLTHGFEADRDAVAALAAGLGLADVVHLSADAATPLGSCLNLLVDAADGDVVAKMDDDDLYGEHYLSDQLYAMGYSGARVVGKQAHYMHLEASGATVLRFAEREHQYTDFVMGPTIVAAREVAMAHRFAPVGRGEDTRFLGDVASAGERIYSADRFGFVQVRKAGAGVHTWSVSDAEVLAGGEVKFYGRADQHVMI